MHNYLKNIGLTLVITILFNLSPSYAETISLNDDTDLKTLYEQNTLYRNWGITLGNSGKKITGFSKEFEDLMLSSPLARDEYKDYKESSTYSLIAGGTMLLTTIAVVVVMMMQSLQPLPSRSAPSGESGNTDWTAIFPVIIGGSLATSYIFAIDASNHLDKAIWQYNEDVVLRQTQK